MRHGGGQRPIPIERRRMTTPTGRTPQDNSQAARGAGGPGKHGEPVPTVVLGEVPSVPSILKVGNPGRRYWKLYWKAASGWLSTADYPMVLRLCQLWDLSARIMRQVEADGLFRESEKSGNYVHNMVNDYLKVIAQIERLESLLGLNPVERARIRVSVKEEETSLDAWRRARTTS